MDLIDQLRQEAASESKASKVIADLKSARNRDAGDEGTSYAWALPEQTVSWRAADEIWALRQIVSGVRVMAHSGAFKEYEGEPWLLRVLNIDLES